MSCSDLVYRCSSDCFQNCSFWLKLWKEIKRNLPKFLGGVGLIKRAMNLEERVTHSLRHSAAPHRAGEACPHGAKPGGHVCLPPLHSFGLIFFCHQYPELLVASYNNNEDAPHEPDGVALVWNMKYKKATPEYVFHCQVPKAFFLPPLHTSSLVASSMTSVEHRQPASVCSPVSPPPLLPNPSPSCLHPHRELTVLASTSTASIHKHMFERRRRRPVVQQELNGIRAPQRD